MTINVRTAAAADRPALRRIFLQTRRDTFDWLSADGFALEDFDEHTRGEAVLVAEAEGSGIVGFISVWEPERFIHHLYVAGSRLREGIGSALLRALPGWPAARYRLKCLTLNERALAFYRAHRFVEIDSGVSGDGEYLLLESREASGR